MVRSLCSPKISLTGRLGQQDVTGGPTNVVPSEIPIPVIKIVDEDTPNNSLKEKLLRRLKKFRRRRRQIPHFYSDTESYRSDETDVSDTVGSNISHSSNECKYKFSLKNSRHLPRWLGSGGFRSNISLRSSTDSAASADPKISHRPVEASGTRFLAISPQRRH